MRLLSVSLLFGGLATLVHAAGFADLAAQLPACGVGTYRGRSILMLTNTAAGMHTSINSPVYMYIEQQYMSLHGSNLSRSDASMRRHELHGQRIVE